MYKPHLWLPILCVALTSCTSDPGDELPLSADDAPEATAPEAAAPEAAAPEAAAPEAAADSAPILSAQEMATEMVNAYRSAPVHHETQIWTYEPVPVEGGMLTRPSRTTVEITMDRAEDRLRLRVLQEYEEMPEENRESLLVATENRLLYKNSDFPGRHLDVELPELSYPVLMDALPILGKKKPLPILAMLLSKEPLQAICGGQTPHLRAADKDHPGQPKLAVESDTRNLILHLDPQTWLIREARLEETLPSGVGGTHQAVSSYKATAESLTKMPDGAMAFPADASKAVGTFQEFLTPVE